MADLINCLILNGNIKFGNKSQVLCRNFKVFKTFNT